MATSPPPAAKEHITSQEAVIYSKGTPEWKLLNGGLAAPTPRARRADAHQATTAELFKRAIEKAGKSIPNVEPLSSFRYSKLRTEESEIRILRLYPSKHPDDPLKADLFKRKLEEIDGKYEALSYCWGTEGPNCEIQIRDLNATSPVVRTRNLPRKPGEGDSLTDRLFSLSGAITHTDFKIRRNLHDALKRLRSKYSDVFLWVDAICIDQSKEGAEEKQGQLAMMARIYNSAASVCVWLGEDDGGAESAFKLVHDIMNYKNFDGMMRDRGKMADWGHLTRLMRADWFTRRWVIQEIAMSRDASIHCGERRIHWDDFADAVSLLVENIELMRVEFRDEVFDDIENSSASILIQTLCNICRLSDEDGSRGTIISRLLDVETLVSTLLAFQATYPRDTIYSILSLAKDMPEFEEEWQKVHLEQLKLVKDYKLRRMKDARDRFEDKKRRLEEHLTRNQGLSSAVESQLHEMEDLKKRRIEAKDRNDDAEAERIELCIQETVHMGMSEEELQLYHNSFKNDEATVDQYRVHIGQLDLKYKLTENEVEETPITLLPDYKVSTRDLFVAFVTRSITESKSLDIICRHWAPELGHSPGDGEDSSMPSWISCRSRSSFGLPGTARGRQNGENLVAYLPHDQRRRYSASGGKQAKISMLPDPILTAGEVTVRAPPVRSDVHVGAGMSAAVPDRMANSSLFEAPETGSNPGKQLRAEQALVPGEKVEPLTVPVQAVRKNSGRPASLLSGRSDSLTPRSGLSKTGVLDRILGSKHKKTRTREPPDTAGPSAAVGEHPGGEYEHFTESPQPQSRQSVELDAARDAPISPMGRPKSGKVKLPAPVTPTTGRRKQAAKKQQSVVANFPSASSWSPSPHRLSGILVVTGFVLGVIDSQSDVMRGGVIPGDWVSGLGWNGSKGAENQVPDALWRLLVADRMASGARPPLWYKRACLHGLVDGRVTDNAGNIHPVTPVDRKISELTTMYFKRVESVVWNRRLMKVTPEPAEVAPEPAEVSPVLDDVAEREENVSIHSHAVQQHVLHGLGPEGSEVGDLVCVLYGCSVPVVLKVAREQRVHDLFEVVGEAYVHGIMDGEFMIKRWTSTAREFRLG